MININRLDQEIKQTRPKVNFYYTFLKLVIKNDLIDLIDFKNYLKIAITQ